MTVKQHNTSAVASRLVSLRRAQSSLSERACAEKLHQASCRTRAGASNCAVAGHSIRGPLHLGLVVVIALVSPFAALAGPSASNAAHPSVAPVNPAAALVLSTSDVGPGYSLNRSVSGARTLAEVSYGDSAGIRRYLDVDWLGGVESAFNGRTPILGIVSVADVFKPGTPVGTVLRAWQEDAERFTAGSTGFLGEGSPGEDPVLIRGTVVNYKVLLYMWSEGRVIATLELIGKPANLRIPLLMSLAERQDARISSAKALPTKRFS